MNQQRRYLSYLLRLWQELGGDPAVWRASLESPRSEERRGFAGLDELVGFLREQTGRASPADGVEKGEGKPKTSSESEEE
jgi:hypothetical protein